MTSDRQIESNRRNALYSTGPRTVAGKQRSARNAYKHGLCRSFSHLEGEDPDHLAEALSQVAAAYRATTPGELLLTERIVHAHKLAQKARQSLTDHFFSCKRAKPTVNPKNGITTPALRNIDIVPLIMRYLVRHERAAQRASEIFYSNRLASRTNQSPTGFVWQKDSHPAADALKPARFHPAKPAMTKIHPTKFPFS